LAAAIRLLARGYQVTILEALERPGGRAGWLDLGSYRFDTGPTLITLPSLLDELCRLAGTTLEDELELVRLRPAYRIVFSDGARFDYWGEPERDEAEIARFDPTAIDGYRRFLEATKRIYDRAFGALARQPFDRLTTFLRVVPELLRLRAHESVYRFVGRYVREPHLRMVFSFHPLFIGGNPLRASAIYSIVPYLERLEGVHFARGGMRELVRMLTGLVERSGGEIRYGSPVRRLLTDERGAVCGVELADGQVLHSDAVVANSDVATTVLELLPPHPRALLLRQWLARARYSMSCYLLYAGVAKRYDQLAHHTIIMPLDYEQQLRELFDGNGELSELAFYLHAPAHTDPTFAPPNHESLYVLVPVPHLGRNRTQWSPSGRAAFRERVVTTLEHLHGLSDLSRSIVEWVDWTPVEFQQRYQSHHGAAFSLEPTLLQSAYFRPHNRSG
ncbi:MAG: phytoene desaturase family protein, partial [Thermomicrobium sp.]|nr:phytoene desaturase family protein [Thermomicrobium sp.]